MGIAKAMPYIEVVGTIPAKGATMFGSRLGLLCIAALMSVTVDARLAPAASAEAYDPWPGLVQDIFNNRAMNDGAGLLAIEMPYRAEDAAIVPVTLRATLPPGDIRPVL